MHRRRAIEREHRTVARLREAADRAAGCDERGLRGTVRGMSAPGRPKRESYERRAKVVQ